MYDNTGKTMQYVTVSVSGAFRLLSIAQTDKVGVATLSWAIDPEIHIKNYTFLVEMDGFKSYEFEVETYESSYSWHMEVGQKAIPVGGIVAIVVISVAVVIAVFIVLKAFYNHKRNKRLAYEREANKKVPLVENVEKKDVNVISTVDNGKILSDNEMDGKNTVLDQ